MLMKPMTQWSADELKDAIRNAPHLRWWDTLDMAVHVARMAQMEIDRRAQAPQSKRELRLTLRPKVRQNSVGKVAYEKRAKGLPWSEVAHGTGSTPDTIAQLTKRYAKDNGKPWPIEQPEMKDLSPRSIERLNRGRQFYEFMARNEVGCGQTARYFDVDSPAVVNANAKLWAKKNSLRWPLSKKPEKAYLMRSTGASWDEVVRGCGYKHRSNAIEAARRYAHTSGNPWPIQVDRRNPAVGYTSR